MSDTNETVEREQERESLRLLDDEGNLSQYGMEGGVENGHPENAGIRGSQDPGEIDRRSQNGVDSTHAEGEADAIARNAKEAETAARRAEKAEAALVREEEAMHQQEAEAITQRRRKAEAALCREEEATRQRETETIPRVGGRN